MNPIKKIVLLLIFLVLGFSTVSAATGLNVVLSNQNPDPVSPGNFVFVNVKVSNVGSDDIRNAILIFKENNNFQLAEGEDLEKNLGVVPAYSSSESSSSYYIGKYKLEVSDSTPLGLNTVNFIVKTDKGNYEYDFEILVQESSPTITIKSISVDTIEAGKSEKLTIEISNENAVALKNVKLNLNLDDVTDKILTTNSGSSQFIIGSLASGEIKKVEFDIVVSPDAEAKPVLLPISIYYEDSLGNAHSEDMSASIRVYSTPEISFKLDSQDVYTIGRGKITFAVANPGTSTVKGVQIEILRDNSYEIIEGSSEYVGNLNPDDFQTIQSDIYIRNDKEATLLVKLTYSDSYNEKKEELIEVPLKIYSNQELIDLGLGGAKKSGFNYTYLIGAIVLIIVSFWFGKKRGSKTTKRHG